MSSGSDAWIQRRNRFQHDWLKNSYLLHLGRYLNILDNLIEDADFEARFAADVLPDWLAHRAEALALANDFASEMNPSRLFSEVPLLHIPEATRLWLAETTTLLWAARRPIDDWIVSCTQAVEGVNAAFNSLETTLRPPEPPRRERVQALLDACRHLSGALGQFPTTLRVI